MIIARIKSSIASATEKPTSIPRTRAIAISKKDPCDFEKSSAQHLLRHDAACTVQ
jgi:hypothetical protein